MKTVQVKEVPETLDEGYEKLQDLIFDQVYKFKRRFGGDLDDLVCEANMAFVNGHRKLVETGPRDGYSIEIRRWVWYELFDAMRVRLERKRNAKFSSTTEQEDAFPAPAVSAFDPEDFVAGLGADARVAAVLVLATPRAIDKVARKKGGTPRNYRSTVREYLRTNGIFGMCHGPLKKEDANWSAERINAAFEEIACAL